MRLFRKIFFAQIISFLGVGFASTLCKGETVDLPRDENNYESLRLFLEPDYFSARRNDANFSGVGFGLGLSYALLPALSIAPTIRQAYSKTDGYSSLFTALEMRVTLALTGLLRVEKHRYSSGDRDLLTYKTLPLGGWRLDIAAKQYLFNTKTTVLPLSGLGFAVYYEWPSHSKFSYAAGVGMDRLSNGDVVLVPKRVFAQIHYWLGV